MKNNKNAKNIDDFLEGSPLSKKELYELGKEHGKEYFKEERLKDKLITSFTLEEIDDMFISVENGSISSEEAFESFKCFTKKVKLNVPQLEKDFSKLSDNKFAVEKEGEQ